MYVGEGGKFDGVCLYDYSGGAERRPHDCRAKRGDFFFGVFVECFENFDQVHKCNPPPPSKMVNFDQKSSKMLGAKFARKKGRKLRIFPTNEFFLDATKIKKKASAFWSSFSLRFFFTNSFDFSAK